MQLRPLLSYSIALLIIILLPTSIYLSTSSLYKTLLLFRGALTPHLHSYHLTLTDRLGNGALYLLPPSRSPLTADVFMRQPWYGIIPQYTILFADLADHPFLTDELSQPAIKNNINNEDSQPPFHPRRYHLPWLSQCLRFEQQRSSSQVFATTNDYIICKRKKG